MLTRGEVLDRVTKIVEEHLGVSVKTNALLREDVGATSLDMASIQMGFEEQFELVFGDGSKRLSIDEAWDKAKTVEELTDMVMLFAKYTPPQFGDEVTISDKKE